MNAKQIMTSPVVTVEERHPLNAVAQLMLDKGIGSVIVVNESGYALGILTERDFTAREPANPFQKNRAPHLFGKNIRQHGLQDLYSEARTLSAGRLMRPLVALSEDDSLEKAVDLMNRHEVLHLPVLRNGKPIGMVSRHDLLRLAAQPTMMAA